MRSIHSADHKHLAFSDGFGLTRLSLPGKVKTERKISAGLDAVLSANPARTEILAWRQNWDSMHHLAFPALKPLTKFDRFRLSQSVLTPDGTFADLGVVNDGVRHALALQRWRDPATLQGSLDLLRGDAPTRARVTLDGETEGRRWAALVSSPAGVWATLRGEEPTLFIGDFSGDAGRVRWRAPVGLAREHFVTLHPFDDGRVVLCAFAPSRRESTLVRFAADGRVEGTNTLASLGPAVPVSPELAIHQIRPETVARTPLDGGVSLTTGVARGDHGVGRVMGEGSSMFFLPWHAESILDLRTADSVSRKLAAEDLPVRRFFREQVARINALAMPAGMLVELRSLDVNPARRDYGFSWDATPGDGSLLGALAAGSLSALTDDPALRSLNGWHWSVGGGLSVAFDAERWDEDEVDAAFGAMESAGVPLKEALQSVCDAYGFQYGKAAPYRLPFKGAGARRFLAGMVWSLTNPGAAGLRLGARALAETLTAEQVAAVVRALPSERGDRVGYHALDLLCCVAADALRHDAAAVIVATAHVSAAWRNGLGSLLESAVRWLASDAPDRSAFVSALTRDGGSSEGVSFYVQRALS